MRKTFLLTFFGAAALLILGLPLSAQDCVFNGDFETPTFSPMWTFFGGNDHTELVSYATVVGVESICMKRRPGSPYDNGGIEQEVHLMGGLTYIFHADIAATESG